MKAKIQGVLYDVEAAEELGDWVSSIPGPNACYGTLYKTPRSDRYFVYGSGGFLTRFKGEKKIIPLTEGEARMLRNTLIKRTRESRE